MSTETTVSVIIAAVMLALVPLSSDAASGVRGSYWSKIAQGTFCQLPDADYAVTDAVALGHTVDLGDIAFTPGMCGQVLHINCGGVSSQAVVVDECDANDKNPGACAIDMIERTWNKVTGNAPQGLTKCTVTLSSDLAINGPRMQCYNRPFTPWTPYYANIGVVNTGGEKVVEASIDGNQGTFSNGAWFAFNAQGTQLFTAASTVTFKFESGQKASFPLSECKQAGAHTFE